MRDLISEGSALTSLGNRLETLHKAIIQVPHGEIWECGCFEGGAALYMRGVSDSERVIRAFDSFSGLVDSGEHDTHPIGAMHADYESTKARFNGLDNTFLYKGIIPDVFTGLENSLIGVAHVDLDQYGSVKSCLEWVYPRVVSGGWVVIDDYNCSSCPGAKKAVDEFMSKHGLSLIAPGAPNPQVYFIKP